MRIKVSDILNYDRIVTKVAEAESYQKNAWSIRSNGVYF